MLEQLMVKDLALIEKSLVEFGPGLNILTGETGAGKSILLGSIQLALGQKANKDMIRHGKEQAVIELSFSLKKEEEKALEELEEDLEIEEGSLFIRRKISEKKSDIRVNDLAVTLGKLKEISGELLDLHGQHEHYSLLKEGAQLAILDNFFKDNNLTKHIERSAKSIRISILSFKNRNSNKLNPDIFNQIIQEHTSIIDDNEIKDVMQLIIFYLYRYCYIGEKNGN